MRHFRAILIVLAVLLCGRLATAAEEHATVSIGLFSGQRLTACHVGSQSPLTVRASDDTPPVEVPAGVVLRAEGDQVRLTRADGAPEVKAARLSLSSADLLSLRVESSPARTYRGALEVSAKNGRLLLVNRVALEDYLRGVVPAEMPASFAPEALKAQAIAARTYTLAHLHKHQAEGYHLCDGVHCQVYQGAGREKPRVDAAVQDTAGLIVTYQGKPISAVYHDTCGGETAACEEAWATQTQTPYLRPVDDTHDGAPLCAASPKVHWQRTLSQAKLAAALGKFGVTAPLTLIRPRGCEDGTRPDSYQFIGAQGEWTVPAGAVRTALLRSLGADGFPSADFVADITGDTITFTGRGNGHGVGLCQWGANGLAQLGHTAEQILAHYYLGTTVQPMP